MTHDPCIFDHARARRRRFILVALAALSLSLFALISCMRSRQKPASVLPLLLVVSGDTQGWITPCGCTANQSGGLPRRGSYIAQLRTTNTVLYADAGGAIDGDSAYHRTKLAAILKGEVAMGLLAHNVGGPELKLGARALLDLAKETSAPLVSANITDAAGATLFSPIVIAGDKPRVAFIGVTAAKDAPADIRIRPAREAIIDTITAHKGKFDTLVILAYLPDAQLDELAANLPEADFIIGGPTGQPVKPKKTGPTLIASATRKGKFLVEQPLSGEPGKIVEMNEHFTDDATQAANKSAFLAELVHRDFPADQTGLAPQSAAIQDSIAGAASCQSCHAAEYKSWAASGHSHAWETLAKTNSHADPSCQVCHTTAYGMPGGFHSIAKTPDRVSVSCEDCHGPSAAHVKNPKVRTLYYTTPRDCRTCHDEENSPRYDKKIFWEKIKHGKPKEPTS